MTTLVGSRPVPGGYHHLVVVSHDCEFNEQKRNKLLVARLQTMPGNLTNEQLEALRLSNDTEGRGEAGQPIAGVDSFVFESIPGEFDSEKVSAFTSITPLPMSMKEELRAVKKAELTQESRVLFRTKLAWFFGRSGDDFPDEEKEDAPEELQPVGSG